MSDSRGFTLIEVMAGVALLVFILLGVATMSLTAQTHVVRGADQTQATQLGTQRLEWLRNQDYTAATLAAGTTVETLGGSFAGYTRTTVIVDGTPRAGVKEVRVTTVAPSGIEVEVATLVSE